MSVTLYGIPNCDTIKKAKKWLEQHGVDYTFHDYRKDGISLSWLETAEQALGWETILNKRGTTYRQLDDAQKDSLSRETALPLLVAQPAMIKRPILTLNGAFYIGFKPAQYEEIFS